MKSCGVFGCVWEEEMEGVWWHTQHLFDVEASPSRVTGFPAPAAKQRVVRVSLRATEDGRQQRKSRRLRWKHTRLVCTNYSFKVLCFCCVLAFFLVPGLMLAFGTCQQRLNPQGFEGCKWKKVFGMMTIAQVLSPQMVASLGSFNRGKKRQGLPTGAVFARGRLHSRGDKVRRDGKRRPQRAAKVWENK